MNAPPFCDVNTQPLKIKVDQRRGTIGVMYGDHQRGNEHRLPEPLDEEKRSDDSEEVLSPKEATEFVSAAALKTPPPSPDGITAEDPPAGRCATCDISFTTKRERSEHLRDIHGVEKPFKCEHCGARFPYSSSLYNHVRIHSDMRPFKCNTCNAAFRWKNSLRHHRLYIHKEEPTTVQIAAKCVLEGKKPPPKSGTPVSVRKGRSKQHLSSQNSHDNTSSPGTSTDQKGCLDEESPNDCAPNSSSGNGAASGSAQKAAEKRESNRKRRSIKSRKSRLEQDGVSSTKNALGRHTCGHCEKEFPVWADLVNHIKDCAEKEKAAMDDNGTPAWTSADQDSREEQEEEGKGKEEEEYDECHFGGKYDESDSDSSTPGGLVIDQGGGNDQLSDDDDDDHQKEHATSTGKTCSSRASPKKRRIDKPAGSSNFSSNNSTSSVDASEAALQRRVVELEKQLDEITRNYEDRVGNLELAILQLQTKSK